MSSIVKKPDSDEFRDALFRMEGAMMEHPQVEIPIVHRFAQGLYSREMIVEPGILWTGKVHKQQHIGILLEGRMLVPDGEGGSVEVCAPRIEVSEPGIKRVGYVLERVRWVTVHATEMTDVDEIEETLVTNDPEEAKQLIHEAQRLLQAISPQSDYQAFLDERGLTDEDVQKISHSMPVVMKESDLFDVAESGIHGRGLIAKKDIEAGDLIAPALFKGVKLSPGRFTNHSGVPNAKMERIDRLNVNLVATADIHAGEEITVNYRENEV